MRHFALLAVLFFSLMAPVLVFSQSDRNKSDWISRLRDLREKTNQSGDSGKLSDFIDKALREAPNADQPLFLMEKALLLDATGKSTQALAAFDQVLKNPGTLAEYAHLFAARLQKKLGNDKIARQHFEALLDLSPNLQLQNEAKFEVARIDLQEGRANEARKILITLEKKQRSEATYSDILWELARSEKKRGEMSASCKWLKKLFVQRPESAPVVSWGSDLATQIFDGKPSGCPMSEDDRRKRIKNLQWAGQSKKAWDEIQELKKRPGEDAFEMTMLEVLYHLHEGEVTEALGLMIPIYDEHKSNFNYLTTLATAAARSGDSQLAVGSYYSAYRLSPKSKLGKQALYQSAFLSYQFQDYDGASRRFQEFMKVYATSTLAQDARWHLAWIQYLRGDYEGAQKAFAMLKTQKPRRQRTRRGRRTVVASAGLDRITYWMSMSQYRLGQYTEAKQGFDSLVKSGGRGYYALASSERIHKINALLPKPVRPILTAETRRFSRFGATEFMVPGDDFDGPNWSQMPPPTEVESEENLALNPLSSEAEISGEHSDDPDGAAAAVANGEEASDNATTADSSPSDQNSGEAAAEGGDENKSPFADSMLAKRFERARDLRILGLNDWARWDLYDIERKTSNKTYLNELINEYEAIDQFHRSANIAQNAFAKLRSQGGIENTRTIWMHAYPQAYRNQVMKWSSQFDVQSELIWGIMKAESAYRRDIVSPVGAIGLMQIMPNTGDKISGLLKEKGFVPQSLFEPDVSVRLGAKYLQRLMKQFDRNYALVAAGYNAGPHRVRSWLASFGQLELDEFIEHIPFLETRNYVKRVVANAWVYNQLYGGPKDFFDSLTEPLKIHFQSTVPSKETWEDI